MNFSNFYFYKGLFLKSYSFVPTQALLNALIYLNSGAVLKPYVMMVLNQATVFDLTNGLGSEPDFLNLPVKKAAIGVQLLLHGIEFLPKNQRYVLFDQSWGIFLFSRMKKLIINLYIYIILKPSERSIIVVLSCSSAGQYYDMFLFTCND